MRSGWGRVNGGMRPGLTGNGSVAAGSDGENRRYCRRWPEGFTKLLYVDKRILAYSLASAVIGVCVFLFLLVHYGWWFLVDDEIPLACMEEFACGLFAVIEAITGSWGYLLVVFLISFLAILFHVVLFDRPSPEGRNWRFVLTPILYPAMVLSAFMLLHTLFLYDPDFRTPSENPGVLDPIRIYMVTLFAAHFLTIVAGSLVRLALAILELTGLKNG